MDAGARGLEVGGNGDDDLCSESSVEKSSSGGIGGRVPQIGLASLVAY